MVNPNIMKSEEPYFNNFRRISVTYGYIKLSSEVITILREEKNKLAQICLKGFVGHG